MRAAASGLRRVWWDVHVFSSRSGCPRRRDQALPLAASEAKLQRLAARAWKAGERLPLVVVVHASGAMRAASAYWTSGGPPIPLRTVAELGQLLDSWDGGQVAPALWKRANELATADARQRVERMTGQAADKERRGLERQVESAALILRKELARFLACLEPGAADLNDAWYQQLSRGTGASRRIQRALERLGGEYPTWDLETVPEARSYASGLTENQVNARLLGKELDAALDDPRWMAAQTLKEWAALPE